LRRGYRLDGDRIASIRTILDTARFAVGARREPRGQSGETALDPVCHPTVEKAADRRHANPSGTTYFFCNPTCAEAFENEP
jgi:YHS domain-containing protein